MVLNTWLGFFYQMWISWIAWNFSHCSQFQCHGEIWETNKPIIYIAFIHVCIPCKGRDNHCHGPKHLRLLLLNANILDSLKCFIVFNFNVVEKDGTLINSSLVNKGRTIVMGPNTLGVYQMPISLDSLKFLIDYSQFQCCGEKWNPHQFKPSIQPHPNFNQICMLFFLTLITSLKMKIELALSFVNLEIVTIQRLSLHCLL